MLTTLKIAARNARRQFKRSMLLASAIAFGMLVITLTNAFTAGMSDNIRQNFSYLFGGNVFVAGSVVTDSGQIVSRIVDGDELYALLADEVGTDSIQRRSRALVTLIFGSRQVSELLDGVDFAEESALAGALSVLDGSVAEAPHAQALILTHRSAQRLGVEVGEIVLARLLTVTGQNNVGEFQVVAIVDDSGSFGLSTAYTNLEYLNELLGLGPAEYQTANLFLDDLRRTDTLASRIEHALSARGYEVERPLHNRTGSALEVEQSGQQAVGQLFGLSLGGVAAEPWEGTKYSITTLNELLQPTESTLAVLDGVALGVFLILLLITMVGITNTFRMVLIERTREIGTMRACGMQRAAVRRTFLLEAAVIAVSGGLVGVALAGIIAAILSGVSFAHVDGLQLFLDGAFFSLPMTAGGTLFNLAILLALSLFAALFPANAAARLEPAKALGTHF